MKDRIHATAIHEAAHAVVARHFGCPIQRVWIDPSSLKGGFVVGQPASGYDPRIDAMIAAASTEGLAGCGVPVPHDNHFLSDAAQMLAAAEQAHPDNEMAQERFCRRAHRDVAALFRAPAWQAACHALADRLVAEHEIDGPTAEKIIDAHLAP